MKTERLTEAILKQNQEIELFNNDDIYSVAQMILCEAQELVESVENAFLTDDLTSVASEAADCYYLLIRLFDLMGIDERAVELKIKRNYFKYGKATNREQAIIDWEERGGDKKFFEDELNSV